MNMTEELRCMLDERGVEWTKPKSATEFIQTTFLRNGWGIEVLERNIGLCVTATNIFDTPEQAIAATMGSNAKPCYATDYTHARCKYSANREWTEDTKFYIPTVTLRSRKLTVEQVREAIYRHGVNDGSVYSVFKGSFQAITDELNAMLSATNKPNGELWEPKRAVCSECGTLLSDYILCTPCAEKFNATLGDGECEIVEHYVASTRSEVGRERVKLSCGHIVERHSKYCQECGRKIRKVVKR